MSSFLNEIPSSFPDGLEEGIAFIADKDYDERPVKVYQDILLTLIRRNPAATFVIYSPAEKILEWFKDYMKVFQIPEENQCIIYPPGYKEQSEYEKNQERAGRLLIRDPRLYNRSYAQPLDHAQRGYNAFPGKNSIENRAYNKSIRKSPIWYTLEKYKEIFGKAKIKLVVIFTDNPGATPVKEMLSTAKEYQFQLFTVNSYGEFTDLTDPNVLLHKKFYGGVFRHENTRKD
jgi:hypothetical protein